MAAIRRTIGLVAIAGLVACTNDYDLFGFSSGGSSTGGAGGSVEGGASQGGAPSAGGGGEAPATPGAVPCGNAGACDTDSGNACCVNENGETSGDCRDHCGGMDASLECNEPGDCPGEKCCLDMSGDHYDRSRCAPNCDDIELCTPGDGTQIPDLPPGYFSGC